MIIESKIMDDWIYVIKDNKISYYQSEEKDIPEEWFVDISNKELFFDILNDQEDDDTIDLYLWWEHVFWSSCNERQDMSFTLCYEIFNEIAWILTGMWKSCNLNIEYNFNFN